MEFQCQEIKFTADETVMAHIQKRLVIISYILTKVIKEKITIPNTSAIFNLVRLCNYREELYLTECHIST